MALPSANLYFDTQTHLVVSRLQYSNIKKASKTFVEANKDDPLFHYIRNNRELSPHEKKYEQLQIALYFIIAIRSKISLTVLGGASNIVATPPQHDPARCDPITKLSAWLAKRLRRKRDRETKHPEDIRRRREVERKLSDAARGLFGDYVKEMWYVESIATAPESQGRGYGGELLDSLTLLADMAGKTTWLQSSNIANTQFYNEHGFFTVETVLVGEDNPTWDGAPVIVSLMIREPRRYDFPEPKQE